MQQQIVTSNSVITTINCTKFLGLMIDSTLSWKDHIIEITPKLNKACYVIRTFLRSPEILRMVYFSYFHSIKSYGIMFWGNSRNSINIYKIQKRIIWIITNSNRFNTCCPLFQQLWILEYYPFHHSIYFQYLFCYQKQKIISAKFTGP